VPIPPPVESVRSWPVIGPQLYDFWELASTNLSAALAQVAPQLKLIGQYVLGMARNAGAGTLKFLVSVLLAGFVLAYGPQFLAATRALAARMDPTHGHRFVELAGATINAVSLLALAILVLGIIQIGPMLVVAPVIFWAWTHLGTPGAVALTLCMLSTNYIDGAVKPFVLAHGLSTPVPVIFIGVIGGVIAHGFAGLFVGPVVLAVIWEIGRAWIGEETGATPNIDDATINAP
jgi:predicted PurR-regulated permease PerM